MALVSLLPKVEMKPEALEHDCLYVWELPHGERKIVWLDSEDSKCLVEFDDRGNDYWEFSVGLVGQLYGPFKLDNKG